MGEILLLGYAALGYCAVNQTIYADKILIGDLSRIFLKKLCLGVIWGWVLIPVAIIKRLITRNK